VRGVLPVEWAKQSRAQGDEEKDWIASAFALRASADAVVARAPRNDRESFPPTSQRHCERSEAIQRRACRLDASSQGLLAMTLRGRTTTMWRRHAGAFKRNDSDSRRMQGVFPDYPAPVGNKGASVNWSGGSNSHHDWNYRMPDPDSGSQDDQLKRESEFLIAEGLEGRTLEAETFQKLLAIQRQLRERQAELGNLAREETISDAEYLKQLKNALRSADVQGEELLDFEDYHRIFGDPETIDTLVDQEVFFSQARFG
jgi:hypothetical protein